MMDVWAASSQQVIDVVNGDLTLQQLIDATDSHNYVFSHLNRPTPAGPRTARGRPPRV